MHTGFDGQVSEYDVSRTNMSKYVRVCLMAGSPSNADQSEATRVCTSMHIRSGVRAGFPVETEHLLI